jgi:hypothetical protein
MLDEPHESTTEPTWHGIDRRAALKAALGGAAAAAVLNGPRIDRFSIAPGYAAMATPGCVAPTATWVHARNPAGAPGSGGTVTSRWQNGSGSLGRYGGSGFPALPPEYGNIGPGGAAVPIHLVEADPPGTSGGGGVAYTFDGTVGFATLSTTVSLTPHSTWTFSFSYRTRDHTTHVARQRVMPEYRLVGAPTWTQVPSGSVTTTVGTGTRDVYANGTRTFQISTVGASSAQAFEVRLRHSFSGTISPAPNERGNDIAVSIPTITCV